MQGLTRRSLLVSGAAVGARAAAPKRQVAVMLVDGFALEYYHRSEMPNLKRLAKEGMFQAAKGVIPSVTNVNNASLVTASFPETHGITSNYWRHPKTGQWAEMNTGDLLLTQTILEKWAGRGRKTAIASAKEKVLTLCGAGAGIRMCAENPSQESLAIAGPKANMYSPESNYWVMRAALHALRKEAVDLIYISTTDYMMHTYPPEDARSLEHLHRLDGYIGELANAGPRMELYLTADHGMSALTEAVDLEQVLARNGINGEVAPIVKDKHKVHHNNLGGSVYVYVKDPKQVMKTAQVLRETPGVEEVHSREDAVREFRLHKDRVGDWFVLAKKSVAFGSLPHEREKVQVRSHGSRHEATVPVLAWGRKVDPKRYQYNLDLTRNLED
jgi:phosphonoacetate hydrolase